MIWSENQSLFCVSWNEVAVGASSESSVLLPHSSAEWVAPVSPRCPMAGRIRNGSPLLAAHMIDPGLIDRFEATFARRLKAKHRWRIENSIYVKVNFYRL